MLRLLDRIAELYRCGCNSGDDERDCANDGRPAFATVSESDVRMCYRAALSGAGSGGGDGNGGVGLVLRLLRVDMLARAGVAPGAESYHAAIAACGRIGGSRREEGADAALELLEEMEKGERVCCASVGDGCEEDEEEKEKEVRLGYVPPPPDRMAYQTALTACVRSKLCDEAANVLARMRRRGIDPDVSSYNQAVAAFEKVRGRSGDALRLLEEMEEGNEGDGRRVDDRRRRRRAVVVPNEVTYNLVVSACGKDGAWKEASAVMERMRKAGIGGDHRRLTGKETPPLISTNVARRAMAVTEGVPPGGECFAAYFRDLNVLPKRGVGKEAWWEIGRYCRQSDGLDVIVGVQPHRNPVRNGVSLNFYDASDGDAKMGFILLRNTRVEEPANGKRDLINGGKVAASLRSSLIGMLVEEKHRGRGLSTLFLAVWLRLCVDLGAAPGAERINKPLISVALGRFGFVPREGGVPVEVSPVAVPTGGNVEDAEEGRGGRQPGDGTTTKVGLYSPKRQALEGVFGERERRVQGLAILRDPPTPRGKLAYVRTGFDHPVSSTNDRRYGREEASSALEGAIRRTLRGKCGGGSIVFSSKSSVRRRALFGFVMSTGLNDITKHS